MNTLLYQQADNKGIEHEMTAASVVKLPRIYTSQDNNRTQNSEKAILKYGYAGFCHSFRTSV